MNVNTRKVVRVVLLSVLAIVVIGLGGIGLAFALAAISGVCCGLAGTVPDREAVLLWCKILILAGNLIMGGLYGQYGTRICDAIMERIEGKAGNGDD